MASSNRSKFLEMCEGLLARVEPPLRSVLEQASKWGVGIRGALHADMSQPECRLPLQGLPQTTVSCLAVTRLKNFLAQGKS